MKIKVEKLTDEQIEKRGIKSWPIWEKEISRFDWYYDSMKDDFVTFPKGLSCVWDIKESVRKHYNFK